MSAGVATHAVSTAIAVTLVATVLVRRRRLIAGTAVLAACVAAAAWTGHVLWFEISGLSRSQALWLPSVGATCGALYVVARTMVDRGWRPPRPLVAVLAGEPVLVLVAGAVLGPNSIVRVDVGVDFGPVFAVHTAYCFTLLLLTVLALARRADDRDTAVRVQALVILWGAVAALAAEALRLQLTDVVATLTLAVFVLAALRAPSIIPPAPVRLLDDLGAVVLAFDDEQRLVEWNRPADVLGELAGVEHRSGLAARDLLGVELPFADGTVLELTGPHASVRLSGFCHALFDEGDGGGWTVVLRRAGRSGAGATPATAVEVPSGSRPVLRSVAPAPASATATDPTTGLLTPASLMERLHGSRGLGERAVVAVLEVGAQVADEARTVERWAQEHPAPVGVALWAPTRLAIVALGREAQERGLVEDFRSVLGDRGVRLAVLSGDATPVTVLDLLDAADRQVRAG